MNVEEIDLEQDYESYLCVKLVYAIMFAPGSVQDIVDGAYCMDIDVYSSYFLEFMSRFLDGYTKIVTLHYNNKRSLYEFVSISRSNASKNLSPEEKKQTFDAANHIIGLLNNIAEHEKSYIYDSEIERRYMRLWDRVYMHIANIINSKDVQNAINHAMLMDFVILCSQSKIMDDEEFKDNIFEFLAHPSYLDSIEFYLREAPELFKDKDFRERTLKILELNKMLIISSKIEDEYDDDDVISNVDDEGVSQLHSKSFVKKNNWLLKKIQKKDRKGS